MGTSHTLAWGVNSHTFLESKLATGIKILEKVLGVNYLFEIWSMKIIYRNCIDKDAYHTSVESRKNPQISDMSNNKELQPCNTIS